jgi:hypothetical protein
MPSAAVCPLLTLDSWARLCSSATKVGSENLNLASVSACPSCIRPQVDSHPSLGLIFSCAKICDFLAYPPDDTRKQDSKGKRTWECTIAHPVPMIGNHRSTMADPKESAPVQTNNSMDVHSTYTHTHTHTRTRTHTHTHTQGLPTTPASPKTDAWPCS